LLAVFLGLALISSCGGPDKPPKRGVLEQDLEKFAFRRYQKVLDIEVWVPKNQGKAYTASYVRKNAEKVGRLEETDIVNAFVTRYKQDVGIERALVKFARRLAQESGYTVEETKLGGARVIRVSGAGEAWAIWSSKRHVVKVGGRGLEKIPESVVEAYAERYPSRLKAGILDGPLPEGTEQKAPKKEEFDPKNPRPDFDEGKKRKK
jgi:hypothetical protein